LAWPARISSGVASLDIIGAARLDFEAPDLERFPCLALAIQAAETGGSAPIVLNASNEIAVDAFLKKEILFTQISEIVAMVLSEMTITEPSSLEVIQDCDRESRKLAIKFIKGHL